MDDYDINSLIESKNEWVARLLNILTPQIIVGFKSVFKEAENLCNSSGENSKYLMTFQNLLVNIPKWSQYIVATECKRITEITNCNYIEDLISCVHIIQLKALTASRVGLKQKKINIEIPNLNNFIHQVYINCARKLYLNIYLFEKDILPLQLQKNNRELEVIIKEIIINTIRDSIPIENILRAYLDETEETETIVEERHETLIDKEKLEQEKTRMKIKRELENNVSSSNKDMSVNKEDTSIDNKDELLNISNELDNLRKEMPDLDINADTISNKNNNIKETIINQEQNISLGKETNNISNNIIDNKKNDLEDVLEDVLEDDLEDDLGGNLEDNLKGNSGDKIETNVADNISNNKNSDKLSISNIDFDSNLEIMNLDDIDNIEPDISLDIEELK